MWLLSNQSKQTTSGSEDPSWRTLLSGSEPNSRWKKDSRAPFANPENQSCFPLPHSYLMSHPTTHSLTKEKNHNSLAPSNTTAELAGTPKQPKLREGSKVFFHQQVKHHFFPQLPMWDQKLKFGLDINTDRNLILGFITRWFNPIDQTNTNK